MLSKVRSRRWAKLRPAVAGLWIACLFGVCHPAPVEATEVILSAGGFGIDDGDSQSIVEAGVAVRLTRTEIWRSKHGIALVPAFGLMATEENAVYGWGGGALQIPVGRRWGLVPQFGAGLYHRGDAKNLGGSLEFRSGLGVVYRATDGVRVGLEFYHLSNAGLYDLNPGVNSLVLTLGVGRPLAFRSPMARQ